MRLNLAVLALVFLTFSHGATCHAVTAVFDLDWTLIYRIIDTADLHREPENVVEFAGTHYRFADYAAESIELLHRAGVNVAFFSGGPADRNQHVLAALYRRVNRIAIAPRTPQQILSHDQLTVLAPESSGLSFPDRFKKDLRKAVSGAELTETVLIDDIPRFSLSGQERHMLSFSAYRDYLTFPPVSPERVPHEYDPPTLRAWYLERHKILLATEAILQSLDQQPGFLDRLHALLGSPAAQAMSVDNHGAPALLSNALRRLRALQFQTLPRFIRARNPRPNTCDSILH